MINETGNYDFIESSIFVIDVYSLSQM